jgi:hypothetical protein
MRILQKKKKPSSFRIKLHRIKKKRFIELENISFWLSATSAIINYKWRKKQN